MHQSGTMTTEDARAWTKQHVTQGFKITVGGFAAVTALALGFLVVRAALEVDSFSYAELQQVVVISKARFGGERAMMFFPALYGSLGLLTLFFAVFGVFLIRPRAKLAKELGSILERGTRVEGTVADCAISQVKVGNTPSTRIELTIAASDGRTYQGSRIISSGTQFSGAPEEGAGAAVWVSPDGRLAIAARGELFANAAA